MKNHTVRGAIILSLELPVALLGTYRLRNTTRDQSLEYLMLKGAMGVDLISVPKQKTSGDPPTLLRVYKKKIVGQEYNTKQTPPQQKIKYLATNHIQPGLFSNNSHLYSQDRDYF